MNEYTIVDNGKWGFNIYFPRVKGKYIIPLEMKAWLDNIYNDVGWERTSNGCRKSVMLFFKEDIVAFKLKFLT